MDTTIIEDRNVAPVPARSWHRSYLPTKATLLALWPALVAALFFLAIMRHEILAIKALEGGRYVYVLDDTYGHLATARNLAQHGVWTYNYANGFESSISSLIWPVIIAACFLLFGVHEYFPLVLNIIALVAAIFYIGAILRRVTGSSVLSLLMLCVTVYFTPFAAVAATGMEHSLQILLSIAFVDMAARLLMDGAEEVTTPRTPYWLCVLGLLNVLTRFEGLFMIMAVGLLLLCRKRWKLAIMLGVVSTTPTILFGLYSMSKGWYFLPNSLMLKGNVSLTLTMPGLITYFSKGYHLMLSEAHMPALIGAAVVTLLAALQKRWTMWTYPALVMLIILITAAQHLQFASIGWFYRYEAYLIVLVFFGVAVTLGDERSIPGFRYWLRPAAIPHLAALVLAGLFLLVPFYPRTANCYPWIISASYSVYGQQYQMGRFVRRFYQNKGVIANDVCCISFMGDGMRLLDFAGLSSIEALRLRFKGGFDQEAMRRLSREHGCDIAILYDNWAKPIFGGPLPEWVRVGTWTIPNNTVVAGDTVTFYATSKEKAPALISALRQFSTALPKDVRQEGLYRGPDSLSPVGVYFPSGGDKAAMHFWTKETAQFNIFPADEQVLATPDAKLSLAVYPINANQVIDVYFNDELVLTKTVLPAEALNWGSFTVPVKWHAGENTIKLVGHGTPAVRPGADPRPSLFAVLDPRRLRNSDGSVTPQPEVAQSKE